MHLVSFDDAATSCRVHASLSVAGVVAAPTLTRAAALNVAETGIDVSDDVARLRRGATDAEALLAECLDGADDDRVEGWRDYVLAVAAAAPTLKVDLAIEADDGGDVSACRARLDLVVDDHELVGAIARDLPDVVDVGLSWAETTARVELVTLQGATYEVVEGDRWQCVVVVRWPTGSATFNAGVPDSMLGTAQALGTDRGLCDVWPVGDHLAAWLSSPSPFIHSDRVVAGARFGALRQRAAWLALCDRGVALIGGTFTRADLKRLTWPVAWSGSVAAVDRVAHEAALASLKADGLQALDDSPDAVAVVVEAGAVVALVGEVAP